MGGPTAPAPSLPDLGVDVAGAMSAAAGFHLAADRVRDVVRGLLAALEGARASPDSPDAAACWSDDEPGTSFAHGTGGSSGYRREAADLLAVLARLGPAVDVVGDALAATVRALETADDSARAGIPPGPDR